MAIDVLRNRLSSTGVGVISPYKQHIVNAGVASAGSGGEDGRAAADAQQLHAEEQSLARAQFRLRARARPLHRSGPAWRYCPSGYWDNRRRT